MRDHLQKLSAVTAQIRLPQSVIARDGPESSTRTVGATPTCYSCGKDPSAQPTLKFYVQKNFALGRFWVLVGHAVFGIARQQADNFVLRSGRVHRDELQKLAFRNNSVSSFSRIVNNLTLESRLATSWSNYAGPRYHIHRIADIAPSDCHSLRTLKQNLREKKFKTATPEKQILRLLDRQPRSFGRKAFNLFSRK
ncbi:hypothetical protein KIN20_006200 [Parelaphostrongylus tenuis]|uniref:Uncharacterized protein n=1 Tax=Parelaphostrongylus tenuis TaxID=148309 RepID=A0AAD5M1E7_PARTN|nr:hypothetical protein KIN20_006200 [Parelaphostrongylus tenuis]